MPLVSIHEGWKNNFMIFYSWIKNKCTNVPPPATFVPRIFSRLLWFLFWWVIVDSFML